jgi:hypothetical protein
LDFMNDRFNPVAPDGSADPTINAALLTQQTTPVWWFSGGNKPIWCKATVTLPNGQTATIVGEGNVSVYTPTITSLVPATNTEVILDTNNLSDIYLGVGQNNTSGINDMEWHLYVNISTNFHGHGTYVQLINRNFSWNQLLGLPYSDSTSGAYWLDTQYPYGASGPFDTGHTLTNEDWNFSDGPNIIGPLHSYANCTDSFKTYVCFQPTGSGSIPVTIGRVDWGWQGNAVLSGGVWSLTTNNIVTPTLHTDNSFPQWQYTHTQ